MRMWILLLLAAAARAQTGPSFDCIKAARPDEKAVCSDLTLSKLDRELAAAYRQRLQSASPAQKGELQSAQLRWLADRGKRCGAAIACLKESYEQRLAALRQSQPGAQSFVLTIHPSLPKFECKIPLRREDDQYIPERIEITRAGQPKPSQVIEIEKGAADGHFQGMEYFWAVDMNFDGYLDLQLLSSFGATGNTSSMYWLYTPSSGRFEFHKELSDLSGASPDPKTRRIHSYSKGGHAGAIFFSSDHQWENGQLVTVREESQDTDPADASQEHYINVVKERRGGKLVEVKRSRVKLQ